MNKWPIDPADVALGNLDADERDQVADLMRDPEFSARVDELSLLVNRLGDMQDDIWRRDGPPPLDPQMFEDVPEASRHGAKAPRRWWPSLAIAAAAVAVVVVAGVAGLFGESDTRTIALQPIGGTPGQATIEISGSEMHLVGTGLPASAVDTHYEAWLGRSDGSMVSIGTFTVGASGEVDGRMELDVDPADFSAIDVSLEANDGNPAHSQRSVLHADI